MDRLVIEMGTNQLMVVRKGSSTATTAPLPLQLISYSPPHPNTSRLSLSCWSRLNVCHNQWVFKRWCKDIKNGAKQVSWAACSAAWVLPPRRPCQLHEVGGGGIVDRMTWKGTNRRVRGGHISCNSEGLTDSPMTTCLEFISPPRNERWMEAQVDNLHSVIWSSQLNLNGSKHVVCFLPRIPESGLERSSGTLHVLASFPVTGQLRSMPERSGEWSLLLWRSRHPIYPGSKSVARGACKYPGGLVRESNPSQPIFQDEFKHAFLSLVGCP